MTDEPRTEPNDDEAVLVEPPPAPMPELLADDLLVEDVSIDGMCGVY